jgi:protein-histidine pros-kinase
MQIRVRMNLILLCVLSASCLMTIILSYMVETRRARDDVEHDGNLLIALASATRRYTVEEIRPNLRASEQEPFHPQVVPAYAAQRVFSLIRDEFPGFLYREAVLNPTNRVDLANAWETSVIKQFREDSAVKVAKGEIDAEGTHKYFLAKPITITDPACLVCHSNPDAAPANMLNIYGKSNGFGWRLGETVGAQIITVPATATYERARASVLNYAVSTIAVFAILVIAINLLLDRAIFSPLRRIIGAAERFAAGDVGEPNLKDGRRDEIGALERAVKLVWRSFNALVRDRGDHDKPQAER